MELLVMAFLLAGSAFFSASETALFSLPRHRLRKLQQNPGITARSITALLESQRTLLVTVLLGNMFVNVLYSSLAVLYGARLAAHRGYYVFAAVDAVALVVLIIFGEVVPKSVAVNLPLTVARLLSPALLGFWYAILPLRVFFDVVVRVLTTLVPGDKEVGAVSQEDLANLLEIGSDHGLLTPWERRMLEEVIEFSGIEVREVMTPRISVALYNVDAGREGLLELIRESKHSKIPVWKSDHDNLVGVIHSKDVFLNPEKPIEALVRKVKFFPETAKIDGILRRLLAEEKTMAMVVDEYGGLEGIVTLEDIVEEIVGEIEDEFDKSASKVTRLSEGRYMVSADMTLRDWNDTAGTSLADEKVETLSGVVAMHLDRLPQKGDSVELEGYRFTVLRVVEERPKLILAERLAPRRRKRKKDA